MSEQNSILDEIAAEVGQLTDEEIATTAAAIQAKREKAKLSMTPERAQKMKDREKKRRLTNSAILKLAKEKGLLPAAPPAQG